MAFLSIERVSKYFPVLEEASTRAGRQALFCVFKDVDLRIAPGEFVILIGHSGCGKKECRRYPIDHHREEEYVVITRTEATVQILAAKKAKGLTFEAIAEAVGRHKVWVTAALMGQATMSADEATAVARILGLGPEVAEALQEMPMKGSLDSTVPVDPLIYRFHEITQVYGTTIKALIHEMFGDGIMSAIDFEMDIQKVEDPKGDRVVVTYNGKFLEYRKIKRPFPPITTPLRAGVSPYAPHQRRAGAGCSRKAAGSPAQIGPGDGHSPHRAAFTNAAL